MGSRLSSMAGPSRPVLNTILVDGIPLEPVQRARLESMFKHILYWPRGSKEAYPDDLARADVVYGYLPRIESKSDVPNLKFIQLTSAGADVELESPLFKDPAAREVVMATAAGVHTSSIPQYFIATTLALFHKLQEQIVIAQTEKRWAGEGEIAGQLFIRSLRGMTVGVLGYGHIGREAARLAAAFGARVIAATSDGVRKKQAGYLVPGTGDPDGSIPSAYYSTKDEASLAAFLRATDVLLLALPSTPATRGIINAARLAHLRAGSVRWTSWRRILSYGIREPRWLMWWITSADIEHVI